MRAGRGRVRSHSASWLRIPYNLYKPRDHPSHASVAAPVLAGWYCVHSTAYSTLSPCVGVYAVIVGGREKQPHPHPTRLVTQL